MKREQVIAFLEQFAPLELAESWDNVGLLLGDPAREVRTILTCLTLTPDVAAEAVQQQVDLIVTHHPILFRPVQKLTTATAEGAMLLELAAQRIAVYSPHTAFDSARHGINQQWAERLKLEQIQPLIPKEATTGTAIGTTTKITAPVGTGRFGCLPQPVSLEQLRGQVEQLTGQTVLPFVGTRQQPVQNIAIACGAAAEFLHNAHQLGCDVLITGEARFHACLEARSLGISLIITGHYASEHFACEHLAEILKQQFPELKIFASQQETDPIQFA